MTAILMYHRVADIAPDPHRLCVSPSEFGHHLDYLASHYRVVPLAQVAQAVADRNVPGDAVALTFDDGTLDALEWASPQLVDRGLPATFFATTERLGEEHEAWWDTLARILLDAAVVPESLEVALGDTVQSLDTATIEQRASAYTTIHRRLMVAALADRERTMSCVVDWSGLALPPRRTHRVMLPHEIRQLAARPGHTIGAHSVNHLRLPNQPFEIQEREVRQSKDELEAVLDREVTLFSYPYGGCDDRTIESARKAGFRAAVGTSPARVTAACDVWDLPRLNVKNDGVSGLEALLAD
jgi:peptidoglycan/xylan/chitin deacetylase (PgdA/CDA1 family)